MHFTVVDKEQFREGLEGQLTSRESWTATSQVRACVRAGALSWGGTFLHVTCAECTAVCGS